MLKTLRRFVANESGAAAAEYALIAVGVAVAIVAALTTLGAMLATTFDTVNGYLK